MMRVKRGVREDSHENSIYSIYNPRNIFILAGKNQPTSSQEGEVGATQIQIQDGSHRRLMKELEEICKCGMKNF